jgi:DnaJ-class molecular chaperone
MEAENSNGIAVPTIQVHCPLCQGDIEVRWYVCPNCKGLALLYDAPGQEPEKTNFCVLCGYKLIE